MKKLACVPQSALFEEELYNLVVTDMRGCVQGRGPLVVLEPERCSFFDEVADVIDGLLFKDGLDESCP